jgi:predicted ATPase
MESYQTWLGEGPELAVLRMLGLFDRPADEKALEALLKPPAILCLTESLTDLRPAEWQTILARLRRGRLLAREDPHNPGQLDTHPLVREYFGDQLRYQRTGAWKECNQRLYNYYGKLAPQLPDSFREMEPLFSAAICGCNADLFREALHEVYIPRIQRGSASFAANILGARGALLSVLAHFFEDGRWGSHLKVGTEGQSLTAEDQLFILMQTALYLTATRGMGAFEVQNCYERAESLCHSLNRPLLLYSALMGQWRYSLFTEPLAAAMQVAKRVHSLAQQEHNDSALMMGACQALSCTSFFLGDFEASREFVMRGVQLWRSGTVQSHPGDVITPVISCLNYKAVVEWHFGEIVSSQATMAEAISLAKELNDMHGLAAALAYAGILGSLKRDAAEVDRVASDLIELSTRHLFAQWLVAGQIFRGWSRSVAGDTAQGISWLQDGIEGWRAPGVMLAVPYWLALKAEALYLVDRTSEALEAITEAEALVARTEERWCSAELNRHRAVFLATLGAEEPQIDASFCAAIRIAREQKSISLEKRAERTYAEYRRQKPIAPGGRGFRLPLC